MSYYNNGNQFLKYLQERRTSLSNQLSRRNNPESFRHICAVTSPSGSVLGIGYNHCHTHTNGTVHAEQHGLLNAMKTVLRKDGRSRLLKGSIKVDLIVLRDTGSNSRPCNNCITKHIAGNPYFNIRNIYYSHETEGIIKTNTNDLFTNRHDHYSRHYSNIIAMTLDIDTCGITNCDSDNHTDECTADEEEPVEEDLEGKKWP